MKPESIRIPPTPWLSAGERPSIGFFFNAQIHQILHALPLAVELSRDPRFTVDILAASEEHLQFAREQAARHGGSRLRFVRCGGSWLAALSRLSGRSTPPKLAALLVARRTLARYDAIVVPERTSLLLRRLGLKETRFIHTCHGAGDRAVGYDRRIRQFDFVLLAGEKQRRRMLAEGLVREGHYAVTGYAKFDLTQAVVPPRLFANDRPVVLYNPHFSQSLSSWHSMGLDVIRQFAQDDRYNLIVAPHIRLFDHRRDRLRAERMLADYGRLPHIHVDLGSRACVDMSYVHMASAYLGDVSSQIYEFLARPRPCLFLNAHRADWRDDPSYGHWRYGPVHDLADRIVDKVAAAIDAHGLFEPAQHRGVADTFNQTGVRAAVRAAQAVGDYLLGSSEPPAAARWKAARHG